ncbi:glycosyltransferase family 4 protein [Turicibacter bilis]|uniref:Glycosyltransferase family 4 protein n=1 Tax=Turicibacter bilis TaxID=2735723 RepID=A0ABY5JK72_9FIRM|nr:glycosyltransferase family 4 protein [Turicibacter bilis]MBS3200934.1 glycosyltransferase family 4 protein [Turicibacter bilis]UUF07111.1 glycosyltransferase family 4 protein [Turicibacter bilis]
MKKVLYITTVSRTVNAFLVPHIQMLLDEGYQVDIATCIDKPIDQSLTSRGVNIFNIPFTRNPLHPGNVKAFGQLIQIQKKEQYDMVHVHTPVASLFGRLLKLGFPKLKTIYTAHGYHFLKGGPKIGWLLYYPIEKVMAKLTDVTITINQEDYDITVSKLKPRKTYLMNGVGLDLTQYKILPEKQNQQKREELGLSKDDFVIIMIAELNENKNQIQLIKAMELLKDKYPQIKALLVGEGLKLSELQHEVKQRELTDKIQFLGFRHDINELINVSNIGVLLSYREGLPRNLMELMACGRKIIGTNIRGCRDIIVDETVGAKVLVEDEFGLAKEIEQLYHTRESEFELSLHLKSYEVESILGQLKQIYTDIVREG